MKLNIQKIKLEMKRSNILSQAELARQMKVDRQLIFYYFKEKPIKAAERFGRFFRSSPKDFIK